MLNLLKKIFGSKNDRELKRLWPLVHRINAMEPSVSPLTDENLRAKTVEFRKRIADGETLDEILPEAFAVAREGAKRSLGMRHFDVQLLGGVVLHEGKIAEMKTGEGKTLVATLPAYLNAFAGPGVQIFPVKDCPTRRDAEWMSPIFRMLGMSIGVIVHDLSD